MRTLTRLALLVFVLTLVVGASGVLAQDATAMPDATMMDHGTIACDADLILSLYTAEYHFDYAAVVDKAMTGGAMMDAGFKLADFDYGQFTPLFAGMMKMMDANMSTGMMDDTMMTGMVGMMSMSMDDMTKQMMAAAPADSMMEAMTTLPAGDVAGEPAECTALRASLRQFYVALAGESMMSSMMEMTPAS